MIDLSWVLLIAPLMVQMMENLRGHGLRFHFDKFVVIGLSSSDGTLDGTFDGII